MTRCLRSKGKRALLWKAAGGRCCLCGCPLANNWHADHIIPHVVSGTTNVHEMQALCPGCNLRKGIRYMEKRRFQDQTDAYAGHVCAGEPIRVIVEAVTCGSGKSTIPPILATNFLEADKADFIAWVVPRLTLAEQAEKNFCDSFLQEFNPHGYRIRQSTNDVKPSRSLQGFVTTHQAITNDHQETVLDAFKAKRGILIVDECQHAYQDSPLHQKLQPIFDVAVVRVLMSGNLTRGDGKRVAFLPYGKNKSGERVLNYNHPDYKFIRYGRRAALREHAKIPIEFLHVDGQARWLDRQGQEQEVITLRTVDEDDGDAVFCALQTGYALQLLAASGTHFVKHREFANPRAKWLVVAYSIKTANEYVSWIRQQWPQLRVGLAVCKDRDDRDHTKKALHNINRFKSFGYDALDVLITVQMAYEGMDVRPITHLACLTHIRSWPWLEQMFDRGTRFDPDAGPWERQRLFATVPDDAAMSIAIAKINAEQADALREQESRTTTPGPGPGPQGNLVPIASQVTDFRHSSLRNGQPIELSSEESRRYMQQMDKYGIVGSPLDLKEMMASLAGPPEAPTSPVLTREPPSVEEKKLRNRIEERCKKIDASHYDKDWGKTNSLVKKHFGMSRDDMTFEQLKRVWVFLCQKYAIQESAS